MLALNPVTEYDSVLMLFDRSVQFTLSVLCCNLYDANANPFMLGADQIRLTPVVVNPPFTASVVTGSGIPYVAVCTLVEYALCPRAFTDATR